MFALASCQKKQAALQKIETITVPFSGKITKIDAIHYNHNHCLLLVKATQNKEQFFIYNLQQKVLVKKFENPQSFHWHYNTSMNNRLVFTDFMGSFMIYNLTDDTFKIYASNELGFDDIYISSIDKGGENSLICGLMPSLKTSEKCRSNDVKTATEGYILYTRENELLELFFDKDSLTDAKLFLKSYLQTYVFQDKGLGSPSVNIIKQSQNRFILSSRFNDTVYFINPEQTQAFKLKSKLKNISTEIVSYEYLKNPSDFAQRCSQNYSTQPGISKMFYDEKNQHLFIYILDEKKENAKRNANLLLTDNKGNVLDELSLDSEIYSRYGFLIEDKYYIAKTFDYEKDTLIYFDVYKYCSNEL